MAGWHLITGEYPPQAGGVADYTHLVAGGLAAAGDEVHVWCPPADGPTPEFPGVAVHRELGRFAPDDLARVGRMLDGLPRPRRLLVQWVPHSYGYRSLNLPLCLWLRKRARLAGDRVELMVHEPFLPFRAGVSPRHNAAAAVHRLMTVVLLRAAHRVWVSSPAWEERWRPYTLGRRVPFAWLPVPSTVPAGDPAEVAAVRARHAPAGGWLLGHFGTYGEPIARLLRPLFPALLQGSAPRTLLFLGRGGTSFREELLRRHPELEGRVYATGGLSGESLAAHLMACDMVVQPYPDGVNGRRTTAVAALQHGVPMVTSSGWLTEPVWEESGAAALAPEEDPDAVLHRVEELLSDPVERARMGEAARGLYRSRFALEHVVAALRGGG